ncbi:MAG: hypothetical protein AAF355_05660 [Myxococcota bacterium]
MISTRVIAIFSITAAFGCAKVDSRVPIKRRLEGVSRQGVFVSPFAYQHFLQSELAVARGDYRLAIEELKLARAGPWDDPFLIARLADLLDRAGNQDDADRIIEAGIRAHPSAESVYLAQGAIALRRDEPAKAALAFANAARVEPGSPRGPLALSRLLHLSGNATLGDAILATHLQRNPDSDLWVFETRAELALANGSVDNLLLALRALQEQTELRSGLLKRAVELAMAQSRPLVALEILDLDPDMLPSQRFAALRTLGRGSEAMAVVLQGHPEYAAENLRAQAFLELGHASLALDLLAPLSRSPKRRLILGKALIQLCRYAEAAEELSAIPFGASVFVEARLKLAEALSGAGVSELAAGILVRP